MILDDDDVPFAQLKKQRCGQKTLANSLSDIEMAVLSLTKLQHATSVKGPVYNFLNSPLLGTLGRNKEVTPLPRYPFAPHVYADQQVLQMPLQPSSTAIHKVSNQPNPIPMDVYQVPNPASMAVSQPATTAFVAIPKVSPIR